ncbi:hypothetical protein ACFPJ6_03665 [Aquipuribacter nitratireducens]|uniref:Uncharacterized protein n=1 Tax=Aquipuribacter nitratireducens TaxID=650104 RepID=A0ABW0GJC6_9MICO
MAREHLPARRRAGRGPAVSPQPRFEVREDDGRVQVRVVTPPGVDAS